MSEVVQKGPAQPQGVAEDPLTYWTRVFCRFLQLVFASFERGEYRWCPDEKLTDITISDQATLQREVVEQRPAIILTRGPMSYGNVSMDQFKEVNTRMGRRTHTDLVTAVMTYNCISKEGLEANRIAHISAMATRRLKRTLMNVGMHRVGEELSVGAESSPGAIVQPDSTEIIMVPVSVPFYYQEFWTVEPVDKKLLTGIDIALRSLDRDLNPPGIYGKVFQNLKVTPLD